MITVKLIRLKFINNVLLNLNMWRLWWMRQWMWRRRVKVKRRKSNPQGSNHLTWKCWGLSRGMKMGRRIRISEGCKKMLWWTRSRRLKSFWFIGCLLSLRTSKLIILNDHRMKTFVEPLSAYRSCTNRVNRSSDMTLSCGSACFAGCGQSLAHTCKQLKIAL